MTTPVSVLFVDDDPNILAGLKRLMRTRKDYRSFFCEAGEEALALMAREPIEVVVSDMRMPFMDGAEFLSVVRQRHPGTIRVILSGYADTDAVLRTVGPAHVYLAKPCQPDVLLEAIARPLSLRRLLTSEGMRTALAGLNNLPTAPELFHRIEAELRSPQASPASVAGIISQDVAMTAKLLKLTNSAYFSVSGRATTPLQAVRTLGLELIQTLVLRIGVFRHFGDEDQAVDTLRALNEYSLEVARLAERIAIAEGADADTAKAAYCAGMLCVVGSLVLLDADPAGYQDMLQRVGPDSPLHEQEIATFGASHALIGAYLLGLWNFADPIVEAIAHSCWPSACPGHDNMVLTALHAARALGPQYPPLPAGAPQQPALDMAYICEARKDLRIAHWRSLCPPSNLEKLHA